MATAQQVIDRAGSFLRIVSAPDAAVDATTSGDMLTHLGDMISEWTERGITAIPAPTALSDTLDESPGMIRCLALNLALTYGQVIGKQPDVWLVSEAQKSLAYYRARKTMTRQMNYAAQGVPGLSRGHYNINTDL